jgi:hypothetical protein
MADDINKAQEQLVLLNDALTSLNANIKATFKSQADTISDASKTITSDFSKGIAQANKSLNEQDKIIAAINKSKNMGTKIDNEIIKNEAIKSRILRKAEILRRDGVEFDEEKLLNSLEQIDGAIANLEVLKDQNIEKQRERNFVGEILEKAKNHLSVRRLLQLALVATVNALKEGSELTANIAKNTGLSQKSSLQLQKNFANLAANSGEVFINSKRLNESFNTLASQTGIVSSFGGDTLVSFTQLTEQLGMSAEQATQLALTSRLQGTSTKSTLENTVATVNALNKQNGVNLSSKEIFNDISSASKAIVVSLGMNPQLLAEAAAEARSLGSTLSEIDQIAESLLNFESSIENELTAELLTGKQLNFEKARLLALNNDLAGVSKELANNEELFSSFANGNRITQQAIADTIGISRDQMADMVMQQKFLTLGAQGFTAEYGEQTYQQMLQLSATQKLEASMVKLKTALVDLVTPLIPIIDAFSNVVSGVATLTSNVVSGGNTSQNEFDYDKMASAMSNVQVNSTIRSDSFNRHNQSTNHGSYQGSARHKTGYA